MKKKIRVSLYLFMVTALFLLVSGSVFAGTEEEEKYLKYIAEESEEYTKFSKHSGIEIGSVVDGYYVLEIPRVKTLEYYNEKNGGLIINGKEYYFQVSYKDDENNYTPLGGLNIISYQKDDPNEYEKDVWFTAYKINALPNKDKEMVDLKYSLIPIDGGEPIEYVGDIVSIPQDIDNPDKIINFTAKKEETLLGAIWGVFTGDKQKLARYLTESLSKMMIPTADTFLHMICLAIGENVTIDKVVYNEVNKLSIDFFDNSSASEEMAINAPLKNTMSTVVNTLYNLFMKMVIVFYMIMLVYMGIKILLTSTASKKADYKSILTAWVMGVVMLMFFPYVMKYTIELNNVLCKWLAESQAEIDGGKLTTSSRDSFPSLGEASKYHGTDGFVMLMLGEDIADIDDKIDDFANSTVTSKFGSNVMMQVRFIAAHMLDLPLTIIYLILIGQLLALLVIYYKRVFMIAFLITIFPLVVMLYPLNKIGDAKINSFGVWFKEFIVNVFVQVFHAVTYFVIVTMGVNAYLDNGNWLFMIMSILFLFEGEKIIRAIFNVKSGMNSIGDMAAAGAMAMAVAKKMGGMLPNVGGDKKGASKESAKDKAEKDREAAKSGATRPTTSPSAADTMMAASGASGAGVASAGASGGTVSSVPGSVGASGVSLGREPVTPYTPTDVDGIVSSKASSTGLGKVSKGVAKVGGTLFSGVSQAAGTTAGFTFGMAQRDQNKGFDAAVVSAVSGQSMGKEIGKGVSSVLSGTADKISKINASYVVANEFANGEHDAEIGIVDTSAAMTKAEKDAKIKKDEALRTAYAKLARRKNFAGNIAEILFIKDKLEILEDDTKK